MSRPIITPGRSADSYLKGSGRGRGSERLKLVGLALGAMAVLLLAGAIGFVLGRNSVEPASETATTTTVPATTTVAATTTTAPRPETYIVQRGDNLEKIAQQFGTTVAALVELNGIADPNKLFEGLTIKIPPPTVPPTTAAPATTAPPTTG